jgi:uncharacterized protein (DUF3820 family)
MNHCICRMQSRLNFGKYRNRKVSEIIESDPSYLLWAFKNTNSFPSKEVIKMLETMGYKVELNPNPTVKRKLPNDNRG